MQTYLDFEKPIQELDLKIEELKSKNLEFPSEDILKEISETILQDKHARSAIEEVLHKKNMKIETSMNAVLLSCGYFV